MARSRGNYFEFFEFFPYLLPSSINLIFLFHWIETKGSLDNRKEAAKGKTRTS
jgi:hypothetical protein